MTAAKRWRTNPPGQARRLALTLIGLAFAGACGCGGQPDLAFADVVEGTVTLNGSPLADVKVEFVPRAGPDDKRPVSSAITDAKGFYRLTRDDDHKPGAAVGSYVVLVVQGRPAGPSGKGGRSPRSGTAAAHVPARYRLAAESPLKAEVRADQTTYNLDLVGAP
jgi:hypothetical protein